MPVIAIVAIADPEQIVCGVGVATAFGTGFTTTVAVVVGPGQLLAVGVMVNVTVTGADVVFVNVPDILPDPLAAIPVTVAVLFLVQLYVVPLTLPLNAIVVMALPEQVVCEAGVATAFGDGLTNTVAVVVAPVQPLAVGVIVNVTVIGTFDVFVNVPLISPEPLAAIPGTTPELSLVHVNVVDGVALLNTIVVIGVPEQTV